VSAFAFSTVDNYWLGVLQGITYIIAALAIGPLLRSLSCRKSSLTPRRTLVIVMIVLALACFLPVAVRGLSSSTDPRAGSWSAWTLMAIYSALTGVLWPVTESYVSGGRSHVSLRRAIGSFNVTWSSALIPTFLLMGPLITRSPLMIIAAMGVVHLLCLVLLCSFTTHPAPHMPEEHAPTPASYGAILGVLRLELPVSYVFLSALNPFLPEAMRKLELAPEWHTPLAATWLTTRTLTFIVLRYWPIWHGSWIVPIIGPVLLLVGSAGSVLSPQCGPGPYGIAVMGVSLAIFGVGMGTIYFASLYYAMEVGTTSVDAGGTHEALIGAGYLVGPLCGLVAVWAVSSDLIPQSRFGDAVAILLAAIGGPILLYASLKALKFHNRSRTT
jgi:hypothetical protein